MKHNIIEAMELPKIVELEKGLHGVVFDIMKLLPAHYLIDKARQEGLVNKDITIIETSSGTFALALAMVCNLYGYNLIIVSDPVIDDNLKRRMEDLGAKVEIVSEGDGTLGLQEIRLNRVNELLKKYPNSFWTNQYDNYDVVDAYTVVGEQIIREIGRIDAVIGSVGTGGSMTGICQYLKDIFPKLYVIGVDTNGSVLFGQEKRKHILRGLGNTILPKNVNHRLFDEVHWMDADQAYMETRNLHEKYSLFMGGTSGASYAVAKWYINEHPDKKVVTLFPDQGYRYQETIYNDNWLKTNGLWLSTLPKEPRLVNSPIEAQISGGWNRFLWNNRSYIEVIGGKNEQRCSY
ncbi:cysteine synthase family protein [Eubacterium limosum]|uniref:cysteine synthase family protein n=1 Tax=Eubacterium limosum TaxID=1736 RepID=UPI0010642ACF|nr:cysteine synthase family protein [Eubacterium limosum]